MEIIINVIGQKLRLETNLKTYVAGSQSFVKFIFKLDESWSGLTTFAQFIQGNTGYNAVLTTIDGDNNCAYLPPEIGPGECKVLLYGSGGNVRATTNYLSLTIDENVLIQNASSTEITQTLYDQFVAMFTQAVAGKIYIANSSEDMADPSRIYVYMGASSGSLVQGYWYYNSGGSWVSGGAYMASPLTFGTGLTNSGGTVSVDTSTIATRSYADTKASTEFSKRASKADYGTVKIGDGLNVGTGANAGVISVDTTAVDAIKQKTDLITKDGDNVKFKGDVYANNGTSAKKLATEESVNAIKQKTDLITKDNSDAKFTGNVYANGTKKLATEEYVDDKTGPATADKLGTVKIGSGFDLGTGNYAGTINVDTEVIAEVSYVDAKTAPATTSSLGTVIVGSGLDVVGANGNGNEEQGTISVDTSVIATKSSVDAVAGNVTALQNKTSILSKDANSNDAIFSGDVYAGSKTANNKLATKNYVDTHTPAAATTSTLGTVKVGSGLDVGTGNDAGLISVKTGTNLTTDANGNVKLVDSPSISGNMTVGGTLTVDGEEVLSAADIRDEISVTLSGYGCDIEYDSESNELYLVNEDGSPIGEGVELVISGGGDGVAFDRGIVLLNNENNKNYLHLQKQDETTGEYEDVVDPIELPATGGNVPSYSATVNVRNTTLATQLGAPAGKFTVIKGREALLSYYWDCTTNANESTYGSGTVQWYVGNNLVFTEDNVTQGNHSFDISSYLDNGSNTVKMTVTSDEYDIPPGSFSWKINCQVYTVSWNKGALGYYGSNSTSFTITTTGSSNNGVVKTLYVAIDGTDNNHIVTTKTSPNSSENVIIPAQTHGAHTIYAWMGVAINGVTINTDVIQHRGIWKEAGNNTIIITTEKDTYETQAYSHTPVKWMVVNPSGDSATITRYIDGTQFGGEIYASSGVMQEWVYAPTQSCTLKIACGLVYKEVLFTVVAPPEGKRPYTDGMVMYVDPSGHNNNELTKTQFGYTDGNGDNHPFIFSSNFDWVNGGFQTGSDNDDNGIPAFVIKRGTWIEFDRSLFLATDNTNGEDYSTQGQGSGKHISIIFKSKNVTDYDAEIARCYSDMGINLYAQKAVFEAGTTMSCLYGEDRIVELALNINPSVGSRGTMKWWLSGTPTEGRIFTQTTVSNGSASIGTQFYQASPQRFRIGSNDCDVWIYRFRMFNTALTNGQVLRNYIADCGNANLINERYERNDIYDSGTGKIDIDKLKIAAPNLHIITIEASAFPQAKGGNGKTSCTIKHQIGNGVENDQWVATNAKYTLQGTSSMSYRVSAGNIDIDMKNATMSVIGTNTVLNGYSMTPESIPVKYFNLKANVASSDNANNVCIAQLFNTYNPLVSKAKSIDSRVRDTVEGHPCVVFLKNTGSSQLLAGVPGSRTIAPGETILYFAGDMNNSKKNTNVFGQTSEWDDTTHKQCCIEFANNDKTRCIFKSHNFENEQWDPGNDDSTISSNSHFEFRYPDGEGTEVMKNAFITMHEWVWSTDCDPDEIYGKPFTDDYVTSITYNGVQYTNTESDHKAYRLAKFKNELADYFNVTSLLYYYLFTEFYLMVDNRSKNMFVSYEPDENDVWRWNVSKNYDDDTALGIDNKGKFAWEDPYTIEDTTEYEAEGELKTCFNAANSVLWVNVRKCFKTELINMFNRLESAEGLSAVGGARLFDPDAIANMFDAYQRIRPEALMVDDYSAKYDQPIINADDTSYLTDMGHGEKMEQRRQFLKYRSKYISSKYVSASAKNDRITFQTTSHSAFYPELQITPYSTMYIGLTVDETPNDPVLVEKGHTATLRYLDENGRFIIVGGEQNFGIVNGSNITHIDGAARLFPAKVTYVRGKLQDILLGSETYTNSNGLNAANALAIPFYAVPLAKKIDLRGLSGIDGAIDLTNHDLLEELYTDRAGLRDGLSIRLPKSKRITKLSLGSNVKSLIAIDIPNLTAANFSCDSTNMKSCRIENVPAIDTKALLSAATGIQQGRVTNVSWELDSPDLLLRLGGLDPDKIYDVDWTNTESALAASRYEGAPIGFNEFGENLAHFYLSGTVQLASATQKELTAIRAAFSGEFGGLTVNCSNIVSYHVVTFISDDGSVLKRVDGSDCIQVIRNGGSARNPINDPIAERRIAEPTKPAEKLIVYEFSNWARWNGTATSNTSFENITSDVTFVAVFDEYPREYTVTFRHSVNGSVGDLIETHIVEAGQAATYSGDPLDPVNDGGYVAGDDAVWVGFKLTTPTGSEFDAYGDKLSTQVVYSDIVATALYLKPSSLSEANISRPLEYYTETYTTDRLGVTNGQYINMSNGAVISQSGSYVTSLIPINDEGEITTNCFGALVIYDKDKTMITSSVFDDQDEKTIEIPYDSAFVRLACVSEDLQASNLTLSFTYPVKYVYSDDPMDKGGWTLEQFYTVLCNSSYQNRLTQKLRIGDKVKMVLEDNTVLHNNDKNIVMVVVGFECFQKENSSDYAKVVFQMQGTLNTARPMVTTTIASSSLSINGWGENRDIYSPTIRQRLNDGYTTGSTTVPSIFSLLPLHWRNMIKPVQVKYLIGLEGSATQPSLRTSIDKLFLPSFGEVGGINASMTNDVKQQYIKEISSRNGVTDESQHVFDYYLPIDANWSNSHLIKGPSNATSENPLMTKKTWWTRSPYISAKTNFLCVGEQGGVRYGYGTYGGNSTVPCISFVFCI